MLSVVLQHFLLLHHGFFQYSYSVWVLFSLKTQHHKTGVKVLYSSIAYYCSVVWLFCWQQHVHPVVAPCVFSANPRLFRVLRVVCDDAIHRNFTSVLVHCKDGVLYSVLWLCCFTLLFSAAFSLHFRSIFVRWRSRLTTRYSVYSFILTPYFWVVPHGVSLSSLTLYYYTFTITVENTIVHQQILITVATLHSTKPAIRGVDIIVQHNCQP